MKKLLISSLIAGAMTASVGANAAIYNDNYIGLDENRTAANSTDILGGIPFDVQNMEVTVDGDEVTVVVNTTYAEGTNGTHGGDLFISIDGLSWAAGGSTFDNAETTGTTWDFAVDTSNGDLLELGQGETVNQSAYGANLDSYREKHIVDVDNGTAVANAESTASINAGAYTYTFLLSNLGQNVLADDLGLHWTMSCGNDVIETNVPEPGSIALLGLGLLGLGLARKKSKA